MAESAHSLVSLAFITKLNDLEYSLALHGSPTVGIRGPGEEDFSLQSASSPYLLRTWALLLVLENWLESFRA